MPKRLTIKSKFGFVVLLDALGTRTASLEKATEYLGLIKDIKEDIEMSHLVARAVKRSSKVFEDLSTRFFGDTLLITCEIKNKATEREHFSGLSFILRLFLCKALEMGLMFRGSISLGDYVDKDSVVLGPAIADAANWYESLDMMGIVLTPLATLNLKRIHMFQKPETPVWWGDAVLERPKMKKSIAPDAELYLINWVNGVLLSKVADESEWFYKTISSFPIPAGAESKFINTEAFFLRHYELIAKKRKEDKGKSGTPSV